MKAQKVVQICMLICVLIFLCDVTDASDDCNLPYGDPCCECCSEKWGGGPPPEFGYIVFQDVNRTGCDPEWVMLTPPNNRLFELRRAEEFTVNTCAWSYNLDDVGGEGGVDSDIWVIGFDLTAYYDYNVYLANKVDDPPADMIYFTSRGLTDCRTVYTNELQSFSCEPFVNFWAGGTARIFWLDSPDFGDFNGDGIVNFEDYAILANAPWSYQSLQSFVENWLLEPMPGQIQRGLRLMGTDVPDDWPPLEDDKWYCFSGACFTDPGDKPGCAGDFLFTGKACFTGAVIKQWFADGYQCKNWHNLCCVISEPAQRAASVVGPYDTFLECQAKC